MDSPDCIATARSSLSAGVRGSLFERGRRACAAPRTMPGAPTSRSTSPVRFVNVPFRAGAGRPARVDRSRPFERIGPSVGARRSSEAEKSDRETAGGSAFGANLRDFCESRPRWIGCVRRLGARSGRAHTRERGSRARLTPHVTSGESPELELAEERVRRATWVCRGTRASSGNSFR